MAAHRGGLGRLAIVAVFAVVLGTMQFGLAYSRGEILSQDPLTGAEERLHADLWGAVPNGRTRGSNPRGEGRARAGPHRTRPGRWSGGTTSDRRRPPPLPNRKGLCYRVPARLTVTHPGWDGGEDPSRAASRAVAARLTELLAGAEVGVLTRPNDHRHGIGVAVDGDVVYAVYRACNLGY